MAFLFTMPGVPVVYYGDEIGMDFIEGLTSKEGGYIRTGSRTPMQWNDEKNHGFSESDTPYLPTDNRTNAPTVAMQENDEKSVLTFVKALVKLHKERTELSAEADFNILMAGYPFVYERVAEGKKLFIAINPSGCKLCCDAPKLGNVLLSQNAKLGGNGVVMDGLSFIIAEEA